MFRPHVIFAASAACLILTLPALAASPLAPRGAKILAALDTNKDGFVDHSEFRVGQDALFQRIDVDHDGVVSREEFAAAFQRATPKRAAATAPADQSQTRRPVDRARLFARLDTNKDGAIGHDEYLAAGDKIFTRCDKDGDGRIAQGECSPHRSQTPKQ
jgi:Ca2+-binding EF-hand superfamily protein